MTSLDNAIADTTSVEDLFDPLVQTPAEHDEIDPTPHKPGLMVVDDVTVGPDGFTASFLEGEDALHTAVIPVEKFTDLQLAVYDEILADLSWLLIDVFRNTEFDVKVEVNL